MCVPLHTAIHTPLSTLTHLTIEHCPNISAAFIWNLLPTLADHLTHLRISDRMPRLSDDALDGVLYMAPNLRSLSIAVDYITERFCANWEPHSAPHAHSLETLELDDSGGADLWREEFKVTATALFFAVSDGVLGKLRRVRVRKRLGWLATAEGREDVEDLNELLEAKAREDTAVNTTLGTRTLSPAYEAGVWVYV